MTLRSLVSGVHMVGLTWKMAVLSGGSSNRTWAMVTFRTAALAWLGKLQCTCDLLPDAISYQQKKGIHWRIYGISWIASGQLGHMWLQGHRTAVPVRGHIGLSQDRCVSRQNRQSCVSQCVAAWFHMLVWSRSTHHAGFPAAFQLQLDSTCAW